MKTKVVSRIVIPIIAIGLCSILSLSSFRPEQKIKIGFLVHDLVSDRWRSDLEGFSNKVTELGGEPVTRNAFGDAQTQIKQGKELVDQGVKVIAVVAQNGKALAELVAYANQAGATIIAYDRMILNCDLPYYISFNSVKVGEMMADYMLELKPKGNYVILNGPSTDNNALLVRRGVMNKLKTPIENGDIKILLDKEMDSWYALSSMLIMQDFLADNKEPVDVVIAPNDNLAGGALDAFKLSKLKIPLFTGQDATVDGCRNIMDDLQTMTIFKSKRLSSEGAMLAMKIAKGERINITTTLNNGKRDVPSILFDPVIIDKSNLRRLLIPDHIKEADLN